jgi:hypothetical protein
LNPHVQALCWAFCGLAMHQFLTRRAMSAMHTFSFLSFLAAFLRTVPHHCRGHACCLLRDACRAQWHPPLPPLAAFCDPPPADPPCGAPSSAAALSSTNFTISATDFGRLGAAVAAALAAWATAVSIVSWAATASGASWAPGRAAPASCWTPSILRAYTQDPRASGSSFPWQSLELIPSGSRPNN